MTDISHVNLRLIDTTVLLIFLSLMRHRKATEVAREMGLTQPAVSHALKRLRTLYEDPLFLRRAHGLEPTALAHELEPKIRRIVRLLSQTLENPDQFDPASTATDLRIGAFDYELTTVIPKLAAEMRTLSPSINVHAYPLVYTEALDALVHGRLDLAIGYFDIPLRSEATFVVEDLYSERYVLAGRRGHPLLSDNPTLEEMAQADHLLVSPHGLIRNRVDEALRMQGYQRNIRTVVPSLFAALSIIENSELVMTLPERVAVGNWQPFDIVHKPLPIDVGDFQLQAVRHARDANSPLHAWLLENLRRIVSS
ncbi:transcriptional regulator, LysR family protein [Oceanicola granulosus HTCC2516]|uniref:Transcriptional regulator, LysR family protein n=1 Tax=Oceanicola granulosus (strain ATCC BAA-861 / DSM 15982 / KCTC 12143 / HTCC2516) TaxID=314256 RepID=Q2CK92_OCEGH|nr:LysR family transcriptional regulator [Oceanicola granulosus]EAR52897.1 transcriptional regulator, LysR family protein [Oceanicola granulosus HTCC2516]